MSMIDIRREFTQVAPNRVFRCSESLRKRRRYHPSFLREKFEDQTLPLLRQAVA